MWEVLYWSNKWDEFRYYRTDSKTDVEVHCDMCTINGNKIFSVRYFGKVAK